MPRADRELQVNWYEGNEFAEVWTDDPKIIRRLKALGFEFDNPEDAIEFPIDQLFGRPTGRSQRKTNRPEKTHEQKVQHLFRLRKGKMNKALREDSSVKRNTMTKKEEADLLKWCEETVTAKEKAEAGELDDDMPTQTAPKNQDDFEDDEEEQTERSAAENGFDDDEFPDWDESEGEDDE